MIKSLIPLIIGIFLISGTSAWAHRLNVFAWLENDQIIVDCNFGRDKPARNAEIKILDSTNHKVLESGTTTEHGAYIFTVPSVVRQGHGLLIQVNAGQGHSGEFAMDASELYAAASLTAGFDEAALSNKQNNAQTHMRTIPAGTGIALPRTSLDGEQISHIVQNALEQKLAPIRQELAAMSSRGPGIAEIVGGIGWIIGLIGIGFYFKAKNKLHK